MARSGLAGPGHMLREALQNQARDVDLTPRLPTVGELSDVLNVTPVRAAALLTALKKPWKRRLPIQFMPLQLLLLLRRKVLRSHEHPHL